MVEVSIFREGFIAGLVTAIGIKTGTSPDRESILLSIMSAFCKAIDGTPGGAIVHCGLFYFVLTIIVIGITIYSIVEEITKVKDWRIGAVIYGAGFLAGLLLILLTVK
jgi:hypothetical protein